MAVVAAEAAARVAAEVAAVIAAVVAVAAEREREVAVAERRGKEASRAVP